MVYSSLVYSVLDRSCRIAANPVVYILDVIGRLVPACLTYCSINVVGLSENTRVFAWIFPSGCVEVYTEWYGRFHAIHSQGRDRGWLWWSSVAHISSDSTCIYKYISFSPHQPPTPFASFPFIHSTFNDCTDSPNTNMNNIDLGRYKRMIQYFWDAEPKNEQGPGSKIWCLGNEYVTQEKDEFPAGNNNNDNVADKENSADPDRKSTQENTQINESGNHEAPKSDKDDKHTDSAAASTTEQSKDLGWPKPFLDDFESRIWMTYRSNFPPIARSEDANAAQAMTLSVRLRSQLTEHHQGFTSDTGWGCMIRSGQSLLANALVISRLGRGTLPLSPSA